VEVTISSLSFAMIITAPFSKKRPPVPRCSGTGG